MKNIGFLFTQQRMKPPGKAKIMFAGAGDVGDLQSGIPGYFVDGGPRRTNQQRIHAAVNQPANEPDHLLSAAIEVATGFDVYDFHSTLLGIDFVSDRG